MKQYDVVIIGAGPAGLSAAAYLGNNSDLNALLLERNKIGETSKVWAEFPDRIRQAGLEDSVANETSHVQQRTYFGLDNTVPLRMVFLDETKTLEILASRIAFIYLER